MPNAIDLKGQRFTRLLVEGPKKKNKHGGFLWLCWCDCGANKWIAAQALRSGATKSCGCFHRDMMTLRELKSMAGKRIGRLTVLNEWKKERGVIQWKCECDCGRKVWKRGQSLRAGSPKSCGCARRTSSTLIDLTGKKFARWKVIGPREIRGDRSFWFCHCECGTEEWVNGQALREGKSKSCGCLVRESSSRRFLKDLSGAKRGRLSVTTRTTRRNKVVFWWCRCDCGKEKWISAPSLHSGATVSCGCWAREACLRGALKSKRRNSVVLQPQERRRLESLARNKSDDATHARILLLSDQSEEGEGLPDAAIAERLGVSRYKVSYVRESHAAPEVVKKRMKAAIERARTDPYARALRVKARKKYDEKPESREKKRTYQNNLPPEVRARKNQRAKEYRSTEEGREKRRQHQREYRNTPQGKAKKRMYFEKYKPKINERYQKRYYSEPQFKIAVVLRKRVVLALKTRGISKSRSLRELLGCTIPELKQHLESQFRQGMSWDNHGEWHVDHIRPCAAFDLTRVAEQKVCFHYTNLQPLWAEENLRKSDKTLP